MKNNMEITTLTTGVAMQIGVQSEPGIKEQVSIKREELQVVGGFEPSEDDEMSVIASEKKQSQDLSLDAMPLSDADILLKSAKEEGFEEALTHLANGDFDIEEGEVEIVEELSDSGKFEEQAKDESLIVSDSDETKVPDEVKSPLEERVVIQERKVEEIESKLANFESNNEKVRLMIEMFELYRELLEEEEDRDKKLDMLTSIVNFLEKFMIMMFVPDGEKIIEQNKKQNTKSEKPKKRSREDILRAMQENFLKAA